MLLANKIQRSYLIFFLMLTLTLGYYVTFDSLNAKHRTRRTLHFIQ